MSPARGAAPMVRGASGWERMGSAHCGVTVTQDWGTNGMLVGWGDRCGRALSLH